MFRPECAHQQGGLRNLRIRVCVRCEVPQNYVSIHNNQSLSFASSMGECLWDSWTLGTAYVPPKPSPWSQPVSLGLAWGFPRVLQLALDLPDSPMGGIPASTALGSVWVL